MRGYYQGYNEMAASAKSQLWEQVVRILYMLGLTYFVMRIVSGGYVLASSFYICGLCRCGHRILCT